jgi:hypothetical protein
MSDDLRYLHTPGGLIPASDRALTSADYQRATQEFDINRDPNQYAGMYPPHTGRIAVDAHAQMLAARVEGLEKDINGLQHVWGRVKALEAKVARLSSDKIVPPDAAYNLLRRCLNEVSPVSLLARDIAEFLRNR